MALDLATVRGYLQVPATLLTDEDLQRMLDAAIADQNARCTVPEGGTPALDQALLRRVQREVAARNLPLGMVGLDGVEYGPAALAAYDALVEQHERAYRTQVLA
jgi:hypothetical protein